MTVYCGVAVPGPSGFSPMTMEYGVWGDAVAVPPPTLQLGGQTFHMPSLGNYGVLGTVNPDAKALGKGNPDGD